MSDQEHIHRWLNFEQPGEEAGEKHIPADLRRIADAASQLEVPHTQSREAAWQALSDRIHAPARVRKLPLAARWPWYAAAAVFTLLMAIALVLYRNQPVTIEVPNQQQLTHQLPDGSSVTLNAGSSLRYDSATWDEQRELHLEGEAFFKVAHGSTFTVHAGAADVRVLGTSFNVRNRTGYLEVSCYDGEVEVKEGAESLRLKPGKIARRLNNTPMELLDFDPAQARDWRQGEFYFEKTPLSFVLEELERQFDVSIEGGNLEGRIYTGYFSNENLDEALQLVLQPMGMQYTRVDVARIRLSD